MSKRSDLELLNDIKQAMGRIEMYIAKMAYDKFLKDIKTQDAVTRNLEIMGEAAKNISNELKEKYSELPWKELAGVRDRLIHQYFGINYDIVWGIINEELSQLAVKIEKMINEAEGDG